MFWNLKQGYYPKRKETTMPLMITCSKCGKKTILTEEERKVFYKIVKTKKQLKNFKCPDCSK